MMLQIVVGILFSFALIFVLHVVFILLPGRCIDSIQGSRRRLWDAYAVQLSFH